MNAARLSVLLVDDEEALTDPLSISLEKEGFDVVVAHDGVEALDMFHDTGPDIVLLDVMLPRMSGLDVCRAIRSESDVPIVMVSARDEELDTVVGLEVGADDYVTKPYKSRELVARMRAALRRAPRSEGADAVPGSASSVTVGELVVDADRHEARLRGESIALTRKEFEVLYLLAANVGTVVTRSQILDSVWGLDYVGDTKTLDVHIRRLRSKIEDDEAEPGRIRTIRGVGYMLEGQ